MSSDIIVQIPGATNVTVTDAPASAIVVTFPASTETVVTVIDRGILYGIQGAPGQTGGVNTVNGQSGNVDLDTSEIPENPSYLYYTQTRFDDAFAAKSTTNLAEGTNQYFTSARVRAVILTGLSLATNAVISATDSVLIAFGKLQAQITANLSTLTSHTSNTSNPHATTKAQVGLGNADNTSDANKPISSATQTALDGKENTITAGTISQYYRGDKSFQTLDKTAVGLANVDNTSDANKPVSTAQQTALNAKQETLVSGTNIKTLNSTSLLGSGNIVLTANPSGVAGAIQFSNGSAFASDATNLFWDDTNNRLGVGTNAPTHNLHVPGTTQLSYVNGTGILVSSTEVAIRHFAGSLNTFKLGSRNGSNVFTDKIITTNGTDVINLNGQALIKGNGSTSATTSLLVRNGAGSNALEIRDDRIIIMAGLPTSSSGLPTGALWNNLGILSVA